MQFPYTVLKTTPSQADTWEKYYTGTHDRRRDVEEGIWRRTQDPANAAESGYSEKEENFRRRIVHYYYRFDVDEARESMRLVDFYLYYCLTGPYAEIASYEGELIELLRLSGWTQVGLDSWAIGDLQLVLQRYDTHPQDLSIGRVSPAGYGSIDATFTSRGFLPPVEVRNRPWEVLAGGIRIKDRRGKAAVVEDLSGLLSHLPFQVEVGCGTSVEAGIPPLHRLHEVYRVTDRTDDSTVAHRFILDEKSDPLVRELISDPETKFVDFCDMMRACISAELTPALRALRDLRDAGAIVGPVITNNFDVLCARAGLDECFVRRYDQRIPDIQIDDAARALLVIGNHADRRRVEHRFRERGLPVWFVDPEGFFTEDGGFLTYPLEGAMHGDTVCRQPAHLVVPGFADLVRGFSH